jgi:carboxypeptidase A1
VLYPAAVRSFCLALCLSNVQVLGAEPAEPVLLVRVAVLNQRQLDLLRSWESPDTGIEIWTEVPRVGPIDLRIPVALRGRLDDLGLEYQVLIGDLHRQIGEPAQTAGAGFFGQYPTYAEMVTFLEGLASAFPDLAQTAVVGTSVEGRDLLALRITGSDSERPGTMFHGAQHGNERTGAMAVAYMAEYLLANYETDPHVQSLVDGLEWFLMPIMNPDGWVQNQRYNGRGVDLNRDWSGPDPKGVSRFGQPETAALRDFFTDHPNIQAYIDFHTYGNMILWPWGYTAELCADDNLFRPLGFEMQRRIEAVRGSYYGAVGPVFTTIYPVIGGSVDYVYGRHGIWAFALELGCCTYAVSPADILPTAQEIAPTMMVLAEWIDDCDANGIPNQEELAGGFAIDCNANLIPDQCEPDFDGDLIVDQCDPDTDNDGVLNTADKCPFTRPGVQIDSNGAPFADYNGNCVIDLLDYRRFHLCIFGPATIPSINLCRDVFEHNGDGYIDLRDVGEFTRNFAQRFVP